MGTNGTGCTEWERDYDPKTERPYTGATMKATTRGLTSEPDKWDLRYLKLAEHWADACSKDPRTRVGAVLVGTDPRDMALGYNGFPPGVRDLPQRLDDPQTKYMYTQHAERNVLDNAKFDCRGATLATTMFPCVECAKSMVSKGLARLITPPPPKPLPEPSWRDTIPYALTILREGGVRITVIYQGDELEGG